MLERCGSATLVAVFCAAVLLTRSCRGVSGEDEEVLEEKQLVVLNRKGLFILESILLKRCIKADHSSLVLEDCQRPTRRMLWKWVSSHRLYNLGTGMCLGLDILNTTHPLGMFECDKAYTMMWWRCRGNTLYGAFQWKVTGAGRLVVVKKSDYYEWKRHRTPREGPCSYPYEDIHTLLGNANGMPCVFPFNYNNKWYSECTTEGREDNLHWCSTTPRYDRDERWGFCPVKDSSCERFWESNQELQACYQFNLYTILTWSQALATCQAQGGNLLSITSMAEQKYIRDRLSSVGTMVWIGLNHLKEGQGWQWSDGAPLSLVNFIPALPASPLQVNRECGVYNSAYDENWQSLSCESALPYICKKMPNDTRRAEPLENWQYIHTKCDDGWWPHNGFCYRVLPDSEAGSWQMSSEACSSQGANLTSIHSLSELEMLLFLLANVSGENLEVWIGLWKPLSSPAVEWSDGSPVTLTLWQQFQPVHNLTETPLCAKLEKKMDTKTFYSARPRVPLALVPENPHDSDADLDDSDDDPTKDPDYQPTHAESTGDSSFETLDEEESPSTSRSSAQPSHKKSRKRKRKLKTILLEETGDSPDSRPPSDPSKSTRRIWKHEDIEEFKVPDPRFEPPEDVHTPFQYFKMLFTDEMIEHIAYDTNLKS